MPVAVLFCSGCRAISFSSQQSGLQLQQAGTFFLAIVQNGNSCAHKLRLYKIRSTLRKYWTKFFSACARIKRLRVSDHSFSGANLRWKSYKPDALKHGSALALPQWAHSQYGTGVTSTASVVPAIFWYSQIYIIQALCVQIWRFYKSKYCRTSAVMEKYWEYG